MKKQALTTGLIVIIFFLSMLINSMFGNQVSAGTPPPFTQNEIIDDFVFNNTSTMNASSIDAFLNSFPGSCISTNNGFSAPDPTGYSPATGFVYGNNVSAGTVINDAAQAYDLNPEVLLVTLQKEQSLVSGTSGCSILNYAAATGYDCPDGMPPGGYTWTGVDLYTINGQNYTSVSGTCVNKAAAVGFSQQIIRSAWLLKFGEERSEGNISWAVITSSWDNSDDPLSCYSGPMTPGNWQICPGGPTSTYDGYYTIDGTSVLMSNGATASLYWYTPHFEGNENFFSIFNNWFGSTYANDTDNSHPNGTLVVYGAAVYLIVNNTLEHINSPNIFYSYGYSWQEVKPATTGDKNLPMGAPVATVAPGTIFTDNDGSGEVYVANYVGGTLEKQWLPYSSFVALGYNWNQVMNISQYDAPSITAPGMYPGIQHPSGTLVLNNNTVYLVGQNQLQDVIDPVAFQSNNYQWGNVKTATLADMQLPIGSPIGINEGTILFSDGNLYVTSYDTNGIYKQPIGPWACYANQFHYSSSDWYSVSAYDLPIRTGALYTC